MDYQRALKRLQAKGLTFADCVRAYGIERDSDPLCKAAHAMYGEEGKIEIDSTTVRSGSGDDGDYVMAWVWVDNCDIDRSEA